MKPVKEFKKIQVDGQKYVMPSEDAEIEKLIQKGVKLKAKMDLAKSELNQVQDRLIEIARERREGSTTIKLSGVSVGALITFRENFAVNSDIENLSVPLGPLFNRFFLKDTKFKTTADFKKFMQSDHALGIEDPESIKEEILKYVSIKETRPNVKMEVKND